jgi:ABC-type branched-subunit amino acid transport system permease subunit
VGAAIVYLLSELLREYGELRFVLLGLALILVQRFARNGMLPLLERIGRRPAVSARLAVPDDASEKPHGN